MAMTGARRFAGRMFSRARPAGIEEGAERPLQHVAIIMDGNGRWATREGVSRLAGHRQGVEAARDAVEVAQELGLSHLTLYSFSTENWSRPDWEVQHLMNLLRQFFEKDLAKLADEGIRVRILGDRDSLPSDLRRLVVDAEQRTAGNTGHTLQIAFNYGGRDEIVRAVGRIAQKAAAGELDPATIDEEVLSSFLDTGGAPDPDLIIRTSGERRISNFLLWQAAYAEFVFLDALWPDFSRDDFHSAIEEYRGRTRRFGAR